MQFQKSFFCTTVQSIGIFSTFSLVFKLDIKLPLRLAFDQHFVLKNFTNNTKVLIIYFSSNVGGVSRECQERKTLWSDSH